MKKLLSLVVVLLLLLSFSTVSFADTTVTDNSVCDIPVAVRQEFIDDAPEGKYLASIVRTDVTEDIYKVEGVYLPLVQTASTNVSGSKYVNYYYRGLDVNIMRYRLDATFSVSYDGVTQPPCVSFSHAKVYQYNNTSGYTFSVTSERRIISDGVASLVVTFNVYWNGSLVETGASDTNYIACDSYGNFS